MANNPLNTYTGPESLIDYHNPDCQPFLPLVEIPEKLNPYRKDGVRIYAKMMTMLPIHNVKSLPALRLLQKGNGIKEGTQTIVEYSSGSTIISMAVLARVLHGIDDTRAYLSNKTSTTKIRLMRLFGLEVTLFGGPSQPEPADPRGGIQKAKSLGEESDDAFNPNQYENPLNPDAHSRWTGPQIIKQLPQINVFCTGMGTSGSMTGTGTYLKSQKPSIHSVGVCTAAGDRVPGPRSYALLAPVEFPWRKAVDSIEHVGSYDSFRLSLELIREGLLCGPSSGFNLQGLFQFIEKRKKDGNLHELAGEDGEIHCVFLCCDLPYQYVDEYFDKLGEEHFRPIVNENLVGVDKYRYDEAWEVTPDEVLNKAYSSSKKPRLDTYQDENIDLNSAQLKPDTVILDLRNQPSFGTWNLPGSIHFPISSLHEKDPSPFADSSLLKNQWLELDGIFAPSSTAQSRKISRRKNKLKVVVVDYEGDTARVATSVLRAKGIEAWSMRGGISQLRSILAK
ncbi:tryptophan synthase beta subunit-like PLP-dependent enzyme [Paecilomyces variotii]|uniref:Tryptophan synthase beta subunit-like PLP-dependent enzyme n=1 Tax=Byssochlamys spectabilis TaxID=264951 RepID=A0A443I4R4_BYSSP|nr:tryptophan synthase beta subunit-like PLP-dependent enzyme [Paecilomyces variotii]RWQ99005.1 tryptophan synthase beta subunit-like PLP-dependent enzyme [Paecilomyces variotii]